METLQGVHDGRRGHIIIMGDINAHVGLRREGEEAAVGAFGVGTRNIEGERLVDFAIRNGAAIMSTFFKHGESKKWTWYRWNSENHEYTEKSMIDLMICNDKRAVSYTHLR